MKFKDLINNRNVDGGLYISDVSRWLEVDTNKAREVVNSLEEWLEGEYGRQV